MTDAEHQAFRGAISQAVDRFIKKHGEVSLPDLCGALGVIAGCAVAANVPAGNPDVDIKLGNLIGVGYGEAIKAARKARAS